MLRDGSIVPGDIIVAIQGKPARSVSELFARLDDFAVGGTAQVRVIRGGARLM